MLKRTKSSSPLGFAGRPQNARTQLSRSALLLAGQLLDQKPAVKSRSILTLRPPELSGRDVERLTEVTRQVALVGKPHGIRNLGQ
jgi:hypothetical protein